ncbi:MAG: NAD(P)H-dependent glycerol-3-phosphate dehydrogenase [Clostridiaceae bacterium]|jgi:glycerol-3-phosphate dehydrogenase (NAD(P)+)|nr:NAD(P)H-dependent glycerol-3-phosphate dehydrogenase [Clostridiaceae bacterium]
MSVVSMIGAGSWGISLSVLLSNNGHEVRVWSCFEDEIEILNRDREHKEKLPGIRIPESVVFTTDLKACLEGHDYVVIVIPSQTVRENARLLAPWLSRDDIVVLCSKGIEEGSGKRLSQVMLEEVPDVRVVALYGPSHAEEVAAGIPTTVVAACPDQDAAMAVQDLFMSPSFRVYTSSDIIGAEIGAALKNVIALCAGISDGLGYGDNSKAALMTRGITEIARLGTAMGANATTFSGLTGIGDLIVTCTSRHSRNWRAGNLIGKGHTPEEATASIKMVVEGISAAKAAKRLMDQYRISMPICLEAYRILFEGKDCKKAVYDLMTRSKKHESEDTGW